MTRLLPALALAFVAQLACAQVSEIGITGGAMYYIGDLNPDKHYPTNTKFAFGALYRYNFTDRYAIRIQGLYGKLEAYDSDSDDPLQQYRNLHFRTKLFEAAALVEVNFFPYRGIGKEQRHWTPFMFAGLAYYHMNPEAQLDDTWYDLQPLGTEGQGSTAGGDTYKLDQMCIPFGAGLKFNAGRFDFQLEWGLRRTYTDYLDDVSGRYVDNAQLAFEASPLTAELADRSPLSDTGFNTGRARGDSETKDWYQYTGFSITFVISKFSDCEQQYNWTKRKR